MPVPTQDANPSALPPAAVRATTYAMPGPGVIARSSAARRNERDGSMGFICRAPGKITR